MVGVGVIVDSGVMLIVGVIVGVILIVGVIDGVILIVGVIDGVILMVGVIDGVVLIVGVVVGVVVIVGVVVGVVVVLFVGFGICVVFMHSQYSHSSLSINLKQYSEEFCKGNGIANVYGKSFKLTVPIKKHVAEVSHLSHT